MRKINRQFIEEVLDKCRKGDMEMKYAAVRYVDGSIKIYHLEGACVHPKDGRLVEFLLIGSMHTDSSTEICPELDDTIEHVELFDNFEEASRYRNDNNYPSEYRHGDWG